MTLSISDYPVIKIVQVTHYQCDVRHGGVFYTNSISWGIQY